MNFLQELGTSVLAEIVSTILIFAIPTVVVYQILKARRRRPALKFFGVDSKAGGEIQIRLSNIYVKEKGTFGVTGINLGFNGPAVTEGEYRSALNLQASISQRPIPALMKGIAHHLGLEFVDTHVHCDISASPRYVQNSTTYQPLDSPHRLGESLSSEEPYHDTEPNADSFFTRRRTILNREVEIRKLAEDEFAHDRNRNARTLIIVGAPTYNLLSHYVLSSQSDPRVDFLRYRQVHPDGITESWERGVRFIRPGGRGEHVDWLRRERESNVSQTGKTYTDYFVIEKIRRFGPSEATVFICGGTCTSATIEAVEMLAQWQDRLQLRAADGRHSRILEDEDFVQVYELQVPRRELATLDHVRDYTPPQEPILAWSPSLGTWTPPPRPERSA